MTGRVPLPDAEAARRGARRSVLAGIVVLVLLTGFTAGGTAMLAAGEIPGLPFAVGGGIAQLAVVVLVLTVLLARRGANSDGLSRSRIAAAARTLGALRALLLVVLVGLVAYAVVRAVLGDYWTLLTAAIIGALLTVLHRGAARLHRDMGAAIR